MHKQITNRLIGTLAAGIAMAVLFAGCGGDLTAGIQGSGAPVASSATTVGTITGFGSIFVDGVEYATGGAQIRINDQSGTESQLRVGQVVTINGSVNADGLTGSATQVSFFGDLRGPVTQIDSVAGTFVVLGQAVQVTDATLFDDRLPAPSLAGVGVGTVVEVSGFANAQGVLIASRVEPAAASAGLQLRGTVQALDTVARTFNIGSLKVDYSAATVDGTLANAAIVRVQGSTVDGTGALVARRVQVVNGVGAAANDRGQLEGVITTFTSNTDFVVNGQRVTTDASTNFDLHGVTLGVNVPVKVRGTFNAAGVLLATKVEVKARTSSRLRGLVDSVSATGNTLTVLSVRITVSNITSFEDKSDQKLRPFRLADLRTGDYVEVRGVADGAGTGVVASLIEREKADDKSSLQGLALNFAQPNFTILGVTVTTDAQTQFGPGQSSSAAEFFAAAPNQIVKAQGGLVGTQFVAQQVEIEN